MPDGMAIADLPVHLEDIQAAADRLKGEAVRTPLLNFAALDKEVGGRVFIKPENLQRTGSFKFRGGYNRLSAMSLEDRAKGVVAFSSGNHAQGVAAAAELLGIKATIVMPSDAPAIKMAGTKAYGAEVVTYDRYTESREEIAARISKETGAVLVPSYDDPYIIAGQGTIGLEAAEDLSVRGIVPDQAVFCCGGGGLSSGSFLALKGRFADMGCYTVEPQGYDDTMRSLQTGSRQQADMKTRSICDALLAESPGEMPFTILKSLGTSGLVVSDDEALAAVKFAAEKMKLVVEPGGAVALAAVLSGKLPVEDRTTLIVLSGGNIDPQALSGAVSR